jgi:hypothetical protein
VGREMRLRMRVYIDEKEVERAEKNVVNRSGFLTMTLKKVNDALENRFGETS